MDVHVTELFLQNSIHFFKYTLYCFIVESLHDFAKNSAIVIDNPDFTKNFVTRLRPPASDSCREGEG